MGEQAAGHTARPEGSTSESLPDCSDENSVHGNHAEAERGLTVSLVGSSW